MSAARSYTRKTLGTIPVRYQFCFRSDSGAFLYPRKYLDTVFNRVTPPVHTKNCYKKAPLEGMKTQRTRLFSLPQSDFFVGGGGVTLFESMKTTVLSTCRPLGTPRHLTSGTQIQIRDSWTQQNRKICRKSKFFIFDTFLMKRWITFFWRSSSTVWDVIRRRGSVQWCPVNLFRSSLLLRRMRGLGEAWPDLGGNQTSRYRNIRFWITYFWRKLRGNAPNFLIW